MTDVRPAESADFVDVMRLFDGALLATDSDTIRMQLTGSRGCILVAEENRPVGAVALQSADESIDGLPWPEAVYLSAIVVHKQRRRAGLGRSLITAAAEWAAPRPLAATFDERVRGFYLACGFEITEHNGRLWAIRSPVD